MTSKHKHPTLLQWLTEGKIPYAGYETRVTKKF